MNSSTKGQTRLQSVQNGLRIIRLFNKRRPVWGTTDISKALQLPKSTVCRMLDTLCQEGFIEKIGVKYRLGLSNLKLSGLIKLHMELKREATEPFQQLVEKTGESAMISVLEGPNVMYLLKQTSKHHFVLHGDIGKGNPAYCSSSGKLLMAYLPDKKVDEILHQNMPKMGPNSVTNVEMNKSQLPLIKATGYCICVDEMHENVISIAAPIKDYTGTVVSAVSIIGPKQRIMSKSVSDLVNMVVRTAQDISYRLGYIEAVFEKEDK